MMEDATFKLNEKNEKNEKKRSIVILFFNFLMSKKAVLKNF